MKKKTKIAHVKNMTCEDWFDVGAFVAEYTILNRDKPKPESYYFSQVEKGTFYLNGDINSNCYLLPETIPSYIRMGFLKDIEILW